MFRPKDKDKAQLPPLRLSGLSTLPGYEDVFHVLSQGQVLAGRTVELPWKAAQYAKECLLSVTCDKDGNEPLWVFNTVAGQSKDVVWSYQSGDVALIHNLILRECLGGDTGETKAQMQSFAGLPSLSNQERYASVQTPGQSATSAGEPEVAAASLEGDLKNMKFPHLLQSISISQMTGKLSINQTDEAAEFFFENGVPVHALGNESRGDHTIMELLTWEHGKFRFVQDERTTERSITKRAEMLLMEAAPLLEQSRFLARSGLVLPAYIHRKNQGLSEAEFDQRITKGVAADVSLMKQVYQLVDGQHTWFEILRKRPMAKVEWIPVMFNLMSCDLVLASDKPAQSQKPLPIEAMGLDRAAITAGMKSLLRPESGLISYPLILYFLEQEYFRWEASGSPFSLLIFDLCLRQPNGGLMQLPITGIKEAARRIGTIKRSIDMLAHFETFSFLLLLPYTQVTAATMVAQRIQTILKDESIGGASELNSRELAIAIGVAGIPEDCQDLGLLLSACKESNGLAKKTGRPVVVYRDIAGRG